MTAQATSLLSTRPSGFWDSTRPVFFDERLDTWMAFGYADVLRILNDASTFSSGYGLTDEARLEANPALSGMWAADGRRHADLRAAVTPPFRRSMTDWLAIEVHAVVTALLDQVIAAGTGTVEIVSALARPLPSYVICRILGLDVTYADRVHAWLDEAYEVTSTTHRLPQQRDEVEFFEQFIAARRARPRGGVVDDLIAAQSAACSVDGRPMSDRDLVGYFHMLLAAGVQAAETGIGNALLFLTEYGHWDELRADPALVPSAAEEVVRWYPSFPGVRRLVLTDTELGGRLLPAGQWATGWLTAANRDPAEFPNADTFDIRRRPNRHLSFGYGRHACLGAALARLELRVLLEEAVRRLPGLRRDPMAQIARRTWLLDSLTEAHFTFDRTSAE